MEQLFGLIRLFIKGLSHLIQEKYNSYDFEDFDLFNLLCENDQVYFKKIDNSIGKSQNIPINLNLPSLTINVSLNFKSPSIINYNNFSLYLSVIEPVNKSTQNTTSSSNQIFLGSQAYKTAIDETKNGEYIYNYHRTAEKYLLNPNSDDAIFVCDLENVNKNSFVVISLLKNQFRDDSLVSDIIGQTVIPYEFLQDYSGNASFLGEQDFHSTVCSDYMYSSKTNPDFSLNNAIGSSSAAAFLHLLLEPPRIQLTSYNGNAMSLQCNDQLPECVFRVEIHPKNNNNKNKFIINQFNRDMGDNLCLSIPGIIELGAFALGDEEGKKEE